MGYYETELDRGAASRRRWVQAIVGQLLVAADALNFTSVRISRHSRRRTNVRTWIVERVGSTA